MTTIRPNLPPVTTPTGQPAGGTSGTVAKKSTPQQPVVGWDNKQQKQTKLSSQASSGGAITLPLEDEQANARQAAAPKPKPIAAPKPKPKPAAKPLPPMTAAEKTKTDALASKSAAALIAYLSSPTPVTSKASTAADYALRSANAAYLRRVGQKPTMSPTDKQMQGLFYDQTIAAATRQMGTYQTRLNNSVKNSPNYKAAKQSLTAATNARNGLLALRKQYVGR